MKLSFMFVIMRYMEQVIDNKGISDRARAVCDGITGGLSVKKAALAIGWQEVEFFKQLYDNPPLEAMYYRARENRAHSHFEEVSQLKEDMTQGRLDPNAARVLLSAIQWQAGKEKPRVYGEKQQHEISVQLSLADLVRQSVEAPLPVISAPEVIDAEIVPVDTRQRIRDSLL